MPLFRGVLRGFLSVCRIPYQDPDGHSVLISSSIRMIFFLISYQPLRPPGDGHMGMNQGQKLLNFYELFLSIDLRPSMIC